MIKAHRFHMSSYVLIGNDLKNRIDSFPELIVEALGPNCVLWLPANVPLSNEALSSYIHPSDQEHASAIKSESRRQEYLRSRYLIRRLTGHTELLPKKESGDPSWPMGIVGSLTHTCGHVGLVLASDKQFAGVGLDAEDVSRMRLALESKICRPEESALLDQWPPMDRQMLLTLVFSFKEAIFKCHFPLGRKMFYFHDAEISSIDLDNKSLTAKLHQSTSPLTPLGHTVTGHFSRRREDSHDIILAITTLARNHS